MTSPIDNAQNYFDLNSLSSITLKSKSDDQASKDEALESAAKQFESIFMQMLLKSMRSAQDVLESDSPFNSQTTKFYRDMHDQQLAVELSSNGSLGLSELIVRQLGGDSKNFTPNSVLRSDGELSSKIQSAQLVNLTTTNAEKTAKVNSVSADLLANSSTEQSKNALPVSNSRHTPFEEVINFAQTASQFEQPSDFVTALVEPAKQVEQKLGIPFNTAKTQAVD